MPYLLCVKTIKINGNKTLVEFYNQIGQIGDKHIAIDGVQQFINIDINIGNTVIPDPEPPQFNTDGTFNPNWGEWHNRNLINNPATNNPANKTDIITVSNGTVVKVNTNLFLEDGSVNRSVFLSFVKRWRNRKPNDIPLTEEIIKYYTLLTTSQLMEVKDLTPIDLRVAVGKHLINTKYTDFKTGSYTPPHLTKFMEEDNYKADPDALKLQEDIRVLYENSSNSDADNEAIKKFVTRNSE